MTDKMRHEFEDWFISNRGAGMLSKLFGRYDWIDTSEAWEVWQAATDKAYQRVQINLDATASELEAAIAQGKTIGEKYNVISLGKIQILRDVAEAIRQGGDA